MIIGFSGRTASGKSAVSRAVATHYGALWVSFGDYVRAEAKRRGLVDDRPVLQDLGDALITDGWEQFCARVVGQVAWDGQGMLVVDGIRHLGAIEALRARARFTLIYVETTDDRRAGWIAERGITDVEAASADAHPIERELALVKQNANLIVANTTSITNAVKLIAGWLDNQ
jgi:dephospho-CoA kinase